MKTDAEIDQIIRWAFPCECGLKEDLDRDRHYKGCPADNYYAARWAIRRALDIPEEDVA